VYNPRNDGDAILKALQVDGLDRKALIRILPSLTVLQIESIKQYLWKDRSQDMYKLMDKQRLGTSSFQNILRAILLGPLMFDVWLMKRSIDSATIREEFIYLVLLGRKNGDIEAIKALYQQKYQKSLTAVIKKELSLFGDVRMLVLNALEARRMDDDPRAVTDDMVKNDVRELHVAISGKAEGHTIAEIMATRSDAALFRIIKEYEATHGKDLLKTLKSKLSGGMENAVMYILEGAQDRALRDARLLEGTMKGLGRSTCSYFSTHC
jgi:annexin A7/11